MSATRSDFIPALMRLTRLATVVACLGAFWCDHTKANKDCIKEGYEISGMTPVSVYPFAGTVTVDHQPPTFKSKRTFVVVMACDASKPDFSAAHHVLVRDGKFEFADGGLPPGKYVLLFAALQ